MLCVLALRDIAPHLAFAEAPELEAVQVAHELVQQVGAGLRGRPNPVPCERLHH